MSFTEILLPVPQSKAYETSLTSKILTPYPKAKIYKRLVRAKVAECGKVSQRWPKCTYKSALSAKRYLHLVPVPKYLLMHHELPRKLGRPISCRKGLYGRHVNSTEGGQPTLIQAWPRQEP